jgi:tetratricopeptide (TPR) repeat protein
MGLVKPQVGGAMTIDHTFFDRYLHENDEDWTRRVLRKILTLHEPQIRQFEYRIRETVRKGINSRNAILEAIDAVIHCAPILRWHERYLDWQSIVTDAMLVAMNAEDTLLKSEMFVRLGEITIAIDDHKAAVAVAELALHNVVGKDEILELEALILYLRTQPYRSFQDISIEKIRRAVHLAKRHAERSDLEAKLYQHLSILFTHLNKLRMGRKFARRAFVLWRQLDSTQGKIDCLMALAYNARWARHLDQAERRLKVVQDNILLGQHYTQYALILYERGAVAIERDAFGDAEQLLLKANEYFLSVNMRHHIALTYQSLGLNYTCQKQYFVALKFLRKARESWEKLTYAYGIADIRVAESYLEYKRGHLKRAKVLLDSAERLVGEINDSTLRASLQTAIDHQRWLQGGS